MIIALTGKARSGKSTVCDILRDNHGFVVIGFADTLKAMAVAIDPIVVTDGRPSRRGLAAIVEDQGWERAKDRYPEVRRFLQRLATEGVRDHLGADAWANEWHRKVWDLPYGTDIAVPDCRFLNEAVVVRRLDDSWLWRVHRPGDHGSSAAGHVSEQEQDRISVDLEIDNGQDVEHLAGVVATALRVRAA